MAGIPEAEARFLNCADSVAAIFLLTKRLLSVGKGSFSGTLSVIGVLVVVLPALVYPA